MKSLFSLFLSLTLPQLSQAYIMPSKVILQKTVENAGGGTYSIEQEVQFTSGTESIALKETWLIENDRTMRVTVAGTRDLQSQIRMQFIYSGGQRYEISDGSRRSKKLNEEFLEKYLNFRSVDQFAAALINIKLVPSNVLSRKSSERSAADFKYIPEPYIRFSRTGGSVAYAFGEPTPAESESSNPGVWIEQDQFVIRKIKLPSLVEMTADNYSQFAKGLNYPRQRTIRWGNNTATVRLISITSKASNNALFQASALDTPTKLDGLKNLLSKESILEFYSRFR
jgi:hypothetical protein